VSSKVTPKTSIKWNLRISKLFSNISGSKIPKDALSLPRGDEAQLPKPDKNQKILLLGISESGKSTLLKSINLLFQGSFTSWERDMYKRTIFSNMVQGMKILLKTMEDREIPFDDQQAECYAKTIFMQPAEIEEGQLSEEVRLAIEVLWKDRGVRDAFEKTRDFQLSDAAAQ
jgi:guanine nucleotide-binding protein subunit alpha